MSNRKIANNGRMSGKEFVKFYHSIYGADAPSLDDVTLSHERVVACNSSLAASSAFSEGLTNYAAGLPPQAGIAEELQFLAPEVPTSKRFEYFTDFDVNAYASELDDERPIRGKFKVVEREHDIVQDKLANRGLSVVLDMDEIESIPNWDRFYTQWLIGRLELNSLRRAVLLLSALAINTGKTWNTDAGKDPDMDVMDELLASADIVGVRPNRVHYGETAWSKRIRTFRAQNNAGGYASAAMSEKELAAFLGVDGVRYSRARYQSTLTQKSQVVGSKVLAFTGTDSPIKEDHSNLKRFVGTTKQGGKLAVYKRMLDDKFWILTVEKYENIRVTATDGVRQLTIA